MQGGFEDEDLADDLVGVTSARLLAADIPRAERLQVLRLLGVLAATADAQHRVRRPVRDLAREFDLPVGEVDGWLTHLLEAEVVRWEDGELVLAALEPPAQGALRLHDFLALADEPTVPRRRLGIPSGVLVAAALVAVALLGRGVVDDRSTPASADRELATTVPASLATTAAPPATEVRPQPSTSASVATPGPAVTVPCPAGIPTLEVLALTPDTGGGLLVSGEAHNPTSADVALGGFTLRATVGGHDIAVPTLDHELVVPANGSVNWQTAVPGAATDIGATLGEWSWHDAGLSSRCPSP